MHEPCMCRPLGPSAGKSGLCLLRCGECGSDAATITMIFRTCPDFHVTATQAIVDGDTAVYVERGYRDLERAFRGPGYWHAEASVFAFRV
jgi:hypothetical protein